MILKHVVWNILEVALLPVVVVVTTPILISSLGPSIFGEWVFYQAIVAFFPILTLGFPETFQVKFFKHFSSGQSHRLMLLINSFASIALLLTLVFSGSIVVSKMLGGQLEGLLLYLFAAQMLIIKAAEHMFVSAIKGLQRIDIGSRLMLMSRIGGFVIAAAVAFFTHSLYWIYAAVVAYGVVMLIVQIRQYRKLHIAFKFNFSITSKIIRTYFPDAKWLWIQNSAAIAQNQIDKFLIMAFIGPDVLAYYSIGAMVYNQLHAIVASTVSWILPFLGTISERFNRQSIYRNMRIYIGVLVLLGYTALYWISPLVFEKWLGAEFYAESREYLRLFLAFAVVMSATIVPYFFLNGTGNFKLSTQFEVALKLASILGMTLGFYIVGPTGLILGMMLMIGTVVLIEDSILQRLEFGAINLRTALILLLPLAALLSLYFETTPFVATLFCGLILVFYLNHLWKHRAHLKYQH